MARTERMYMARFTVKNHEDPDMDGEHMMVVRSSASPALLAQHLKWQREAAENSMPGMEMRYSGVELADPDKVDEAINELREKDPLRMLAGDADPDNPNALLFRPLTVDDPQMSDQVISAINEGARRASDKEAGAIDEALLHQANSTAPAARVTRTATGQVVTGSNKMATGHADLIAGAAQRQAEGGTPGNPTQPPAGGVDVAPKPAGAPQQQTPPGKQQQGGRQQNQAGLLILDGSNATIDMMFSTKSLKCMFGYWTAEIVREFYEKTTFCSAGWRSRTPGLKQLVGRLEGYASKGDPGSDPAQWMSSTAAIPIVLTADTGCTFTFSGHVGRSRVGFRAQANSEAGIEFESDGAVTTAWIVA